MSSLYLHVATSAMTIEDTIRDAKDLAIQLGISGCIVHVPTGVILSVPVLEPDEYIKAEYERGLRRIEEEKYGKSK